MENQKIKEDRRRKFLEKMEKNKKNKKNNNDDKTSIQQTQNYVMSQNQTQNQTQSQNIMNNIFPGINNNLSNNFMNQINNENFFNNIINNNNNQGQKQINFKNIMEETDKYDYMINFQNLAKRILIIILSIIHCLDYSPLNDIFVFKCTFIVLELSSVFFNKYYYTKKAELRQKMINTNQNEGQKNQIEIVIQSLLNNFGFFSHFFVIIKAIKDIFNDISILLFVNIIYFIIKYIR